MIKWKHKVVKWEVFFMSKHIVTVNEVSLQDTIQFESCSECQTSCQSACKTSCTVGNLVCTEQAKKEAE